MKCVYKITPVSLYDVRGVESWLEDLAKKGLFLKWLRPTFSTFERGAPQALRYRAEPLRQTMADDGPPRAMLELYQDFGWKFICNTSSELLIFSTGDEAAPEPHSDPQFQGELWHKLYRVKRRELLISLILDLVVAVCAGITLFQNGTPILNLLTTSVLWSFVVLAILLYSLLQNWLDVQRLALIVQQLEEGVPLDHRSVYPRRRWSGAAAAAAAFFLLAMLILSQWVLPFTSGDIRPLDSLTAFTPLSLAGVEGEDYTPDSFVHHRSPVLEEDGHIYFRDYGNFCALRRYLLCWNQWEVVQTGHIQPEDWRRLEIQWYDLPLSFLSVPLAKELLDGAMELNGDIWWTSSENAAWTVDYFSLGETVFLAVGRRDGGFQIAAAACGDKAVLVKYTGQGDLARHREEIAAMVTGKEANL